MLNDIYSKEQILAAETLIEIISPTIDLARQHVAQFRELLRAERSEDQYANILWAVNDVVDWESGFFVDWKDTESFVHCVTKLADRWGVTLSFGTADPLKEDFLSQTNVPELLSQAHSELLPKALMLWSWDTDSDCYCGWITKSTSASKVADISAALGIEVRSGERSF
jgi:hypothetical protein